MTLLARLALRNLLRHPWRSVATVLGVALGIAAVLATLSVGANVEANVRSTLEAASGPADLLVTPGARGRAVFEHEELERKVAAVDGVRAVRPVLAARVEPLREVEDFNPSVIPGVDSGFQLSGRETQHLGDLPTRAVEGRIPSEGSQGVAIGAGFARTRAIEVGDTLRFASRFGDLPFEVTGLLDERQGLGTTNGGRVGVAHLADLQAALRLEGRASYLEVLVEEDAVVDEVRERLEPVVGEAYTVTYPATAGDVTSGIVETIQSGLLVLAATLMALGGFLAYNTFMAAVVERAKEYALLRTICMTRGDVQRLALIEAALVALLGVVVGIALGVGLAYGITRANAVTLGFEVRTLVVPVRSVLLASGVGVAVALVAGLLPARTASRTAPLAAVRSVEDQEEAAWSAPVGWGLVALGTLLALLPWPGLWSLAGAAGAMAALFLGVTLATPTLLRPTVTLLGPLLTRSLGVAGRLGADFTRRNAARNGVAIGTVIVGMALTIGVGAMVSGINRAIEEWVDTTIVGDLFVTSPVSFPDSFAQHARERVPGLDAVSGVGVRIVRFQPEGGERARSIALILVDPARFEPGEGFGTFQYIEGQGDHERGYRALASGDEVLIANTLRDRFGLGVGDTIELRTTEGFRAFPIGGVVVDFTGGGETVVASIDRMGLFGGGTPDLYVLTVQGGADPARVRDDLLAAFPELYLDVTLNQGYRERILELTRQSFASTNLLLLLAVFIAALGVANTLGMNLAGRRHEVAVLRTLGLTRSGVAELVSAEGVVIVSIGAVLGVLAGLLLANVITAGAGALTGYRLEPVFPWRLMVLALIASPAVGLLASIFPARRAAKLPPVLALGHEET